MEWEKNTRKFYYLEKDNHSNTKKPFCLLIKGRRSTISCDTSLGNDKSLSIKMIQNKYFRIIINMINNLFIHSYLQL